MIERKVIVVFDAETRRYNQEAAALGDVVVVKAVSADLPFTQARDLLGKSI